MAAPGVTFQRLDGRQAAGHVDELLDVHREVYGEADQERSFAGQLRVWCRQPGFVLAEARRGDYLVGFATGMPLRPSTSWWKDLTAPLPAEVTTEQPGRTFALTELLVRAPWRRQGIAGSLHDLILDGRHRGTGHARRLAGGYSGADGLPDVGLEQGRTDPRGSGRLTCGGRAGHRPPSTSLLVP